jgi:elongator complex protein 6
MREYDFWRHEARKGAGVDLERLRREGRFAFVDGLSELCLPASSHGHAGLHTLQSLDESHVRATITHAISSMNPSCSPDPSTPSRKTLLVLDSPDLLLALSPATTPSSLSSLLLSLHSYPSVSHVLAHVQSDHPLVSPSAAPQPVELAHHNFLVKCGHMSRRILSVRILDTGVARDVSGVLRVTEQRADWLGLDLQTEGGNSHADVIRGKEFLYQVRADGSVRVFDRGAGGES